MCDNSGNLYAGGAFSEIKGVTVNGIAKWDGSTWSDLSGGTDNLVSMIVPDGVGNLYMCGQFKEAGDMSSYHFARWTPPEIIPPVITSMSSSTSNGTYGTGTIIDITVNFSEEVTLADGDLTIMLDTGGMAVISPFGPANSATGHYTVASGHASEDLNSTSIVLAQGASLED